jgi:hypothetical protein
MGIGEQQYSFAHMLGASRTCEKQEFWRGTPGEQGGVRDGRHGAPGGPVQVREPHPTRAFTIAHAERGPPRPRMRPLPIPPRADL